MPFDSDRFQKPFQTLIKATKRNPDFADPDRVHKFRTNTRRVEAILGALELPEPHHRRALLKDLKKIRRAAGQVRDMDVLTAKTADVSPDDERNCQVRLLEHLGVERRRGARKLAREVNNRRDEVRNRLKAIVKEIDDRTARPQFARSMEQQARSRSAWLFSAVRNFPALDRNNLHEFRKQGKTLRYVAQMTKPRDETFLEALSTMQTAIGEWHDWEELLGIAKEALPHGRKCGLIRELQLHADAAYDAALKHANAVRQRYFSRGVRPVTLRLVPRAA